MELEVNGQSRSMREGATVADLMEELGLGRAAAGVAVAVDGSVVPRSDWHRRVLADGDVVDVIHAVQGG